MLAEVVKLNTKQDEAQQSVIRILEGILQEAKNGEISMIAVVGVHCDGSIGTAISRHDEAITLLGGVARLAYQLNCDME
jgi:hypothetical protein